MKIPALLSAALLLAACAPEDAPQLAAMPAAERAGDELPGPEGSPENKAFIRAKNLELCGKWSELARVAMDARQAGVPMRELMEAMNEGGEVPTTTAIIVQAYESPLYRTVAHQKREVAEFESQVYLACLKDRGIS